MVPTLGQPTVICWSSALHHVLDLASPHHIQTLLAAARASVGIVLKEVAKGEAGP
jgi:hypothetical protein